MNINKLAKSNKRSKKLCIKKLKKIILKYTYYNKTLKGNDSIHIDTLEIATEIQPYAEYSPSLIIESINQLKNENKIVFDNNEKPTCFSLTDKTFNDLYESNNWLKKNIFNIVNAVIAFWGAVTGTIALFFK